MEYLIDPTILVGTITLIISEIVLGIDNLVFIAILSEKLPPNKRDHARVIGLVLALIMRLGLLSALSWIMQLTKPLLNIASFSFSGRDLILLVGGFFLLFKAVVELYKILTNQNYIHYTKKNCNTVWTVVIQIVVLDMIFSLDAVITAIGIINYLPIMIFAVIIAMIIMLLVSRSLTRFINRYQTILVLCLSILLMIGLNLIAEGLNFHISKNYLYIIIGCSIIIELFNKIIYRNILKK